MTAIEQQKPLSLGHVQASLVTSLVHMVFENISKHYRLGLVSSRTLSHDLNRFRQTKVLCHKAPYLKEDEIKDHAYKGDSNLGYAQKDFRAP